MLPRISAKRADMESAPTTLQYIFIFAGRRGRPPLQCLQLFLHYNRAQFGNSFLDSLPIAPLLEKNKQMCYNK